jgi:hypothetical protein
MTPTLTYVCSICGEPSVSICVYCTKDACPNHICERCSRCSDCCECDIRLDESHEHAAQEVHAIADEPQAAELEPGGDLPSEPPELMHQSMEPEPEPEAEAAGPAAPPSAEQSTSPEVPMEPEVPNAPSLQDEKPEP